MFFNVVLCMVTLLEGFRDFMKCNQFKTSFFLICLSFLFVCHTHSHVIRHGNTLQLGDNIAGFSLAKILSLKYNIPLEVHPFFYSNLFVLDDVERKWNYGSFDEVVHVLTEKDIVNSINKECNVLFYTDIFTKIDFIDPKWVKQLKREVQLKKKPLVHPLPNDIITVALHIRKGNGGGMVYDGEQSSLQEFDFDRTIVSYINDYWNYPFEWSAYTRDNFSHESDGNQIRSVIELPEIQTRNTDFPDVRKDFIDQIDNYQTKFPPDQFYIDQVMKLSEELHHPSLYVQIFTDDKEPDALTKRIRNAVNMPNITICHHKNQNLEFQDMIAEDLHIMSQCDVLIRSESYFSRVAELMGNHKVVIYPISFVWDEKKLIMNEIVIKGSISLLYRS